MVKSDEQYLSTKVLSELLDVGFAVNWSELTVTLLDADSLPVGRRIARERAHALFRGGGQSAGPDLALGMERTRWDGMVLDYSILAPSQDLLGNGAYSAGLGLNLGGGSLETRVASAGPPRGGDVRVDASWTGVWRRSRYVTQLRLGDGLSTGPRPRSVRGFSLSNAPFFRPSLFGDIGFQGALGPGWEIEAYRGGRLIALDSADATGRFSMDLPVEYGENAMDFVAYGPFGEIRRFNQNYRVSTDVIPERRVEYGLAVGGCRAVECRANANLDLRYGLTRQWTVRGGVDQFWRDSLPGLFHPYLGVGGTLGSAWGVEVEGVASAVIRGALRYEPSQDLRLGTEYHDFASGTVAPILTPAGRHTQWTTNALARPFRSRDDLYFEATLDRITAANGVTTSGRLGVSLYASRFQLAPAVRHVRYSDPTGRATTESYASLNTFSLPFPELGPVFGRISSRTNWEVDGGGKLSLAGGYLSRELGPHLHMEAGAIWSRGLGTMLSLFLSTQLPTVRATTSITAPSQGRPAGEPVHPGVRALRSGPAPGGVRGGTIAGASGCQRPSVPRRERRRQVAGERGDDPGRQGAGGLRHRGVRLLRPLPDLGSPGLRAGADGGRYQHARVAALDPGVRLGERGDRSQPVPRRRCSDPARRRHRGPRGPADAGLDRHASGRPAAAAPAGLEPDHRLADLLRRRVLSHRGEARRL